MAKNKTSLSKAGSYHEIAEFWGTHDLAEYWDKTKPVEFDVDIQSEATYYTVENALSKKIRAAARKRRVTPESLLNLWLKEKLDKRS
ncbi:MAG: CopG family antitoxin [Blastocatellia bacterium]